MAITTTIIGEVGEGAKKRKIRRHVETGGANTLLTSVVGGKGYKVLMVLVAYSATPVQAGVTSTLNSGAGAAYDNTLNTGSANARFNQYLPTIPIVLGNDDTIDVAAPAAGGVITASVIVVTEDLEYYGV